VVHVVNAFRKRTSPCSLAHARRLYQPPNQGGFYLVRRFDIARSSQADTRSLEPFCMLQVLRLLIPFAASYLCEAAFSLSRRLNKVSIEGKHRKRDALSCFKHNTAFYVTTSELMNALNKNRWILFWCNASFGFMNMISTSAVHASWEPLPPKASVLFCSFAWTPASGYRFLGCNPWMPLQLVVSTHSSKVYFMDMIGSDDADHIIGRVTMSLRSVFPNVPLS